MAAELEVGNEKGLGLGLGLGLDPIPYLYVNLYHPKTTGLRSIRVKRK